MMTAAANDLDDIDRRLLVALQRDARTPNARLAELAGVAPSTAHVRVRSLVARGVISGFSTEVDPANVGLAIQALIAVNIRAGARANIPGFLDEVKALPGVLQVFFLGGSEDFILHVALADTAAVRAFVLDHLSVNPVVASTRTSLVFDHHRSPVQLPD